MPELPEVETIRRILECGTSDQPSIVGQTISDLSVFWPPSLATPVPEIFITSLTGRTITVLNRRGKYLILALDEGYLLIHLRMSGDLRLVKNLGSTRLPQPILPHDRIYFHFNSSFGLAFNDTRKFGRVWLTSDPQSVLKRLGPEPFDPDMDDERFFKMLQGKKRQLKGLLLDQHFLAGIGNIYADEALFQAGLNPKQASNTLSLEQSRSLLWSIRTVLDLGIVNNGASIDWVYRGGDFQNHFKVYQRTGEPCLTCGTPIERTTVNQRGTHYCPHCQPLKPRED